jgi:hypothetical protein
MGTRWFVTSLGMGLGHSFMNRPRSRIMENRVLGQFFKSGWFWPSSRWSTKVDHRLRCLPMGGLQ